MSSRVGVLVPFLVLGLAACGGAATEPDPGGSSAAPGASAPAATAPASDVVEIKVTITGGRVTPRPSVHEVAKGRTVRIIVTSDENDELHVHGYDLPADLTAGKPATVEFTADQAGRFEVETHERGLQLFQLQVS